MRAIITIILLAFAGIDAGAGVPQFYLTYSKDNQGDGNYRIYYAIATGEFNLLVGPTLLVNSPTAAFGVVSNKGTKLEYVERDALDGTYQLYWADLSQAGTITSGPWKLTNDPNYTIQFPTLVYDKRVAFTRTSVAGGPTTEEVFIGLLHRKKKNVLKYTKQVTSNSEQDTQAFATGVWHGIYYVRNGSIYFRQLKGSGPKGIEKLVLAGSPPYLVYSEPATTKISNGYLSYLKSDAAGNSNLFRARIDTVGNLTGPEEQLTFVSPPARVIHGMISTGPAQVVWVVDKGNGYQELWRQWYYGWPYNYAVEAPRLFVAGAYGDRFGAVYCTEP